MVSPWKEKVPDWDSPSPDNDTICRQFQKHVFQSESLLLPYRLYVPKMAASEKIPLTLFLHGADVTGTDNELQIRAHDIGSVYARPKWQSLQPQFILAPQYHTMIHWSREDVMVALIHIIDDLCETYPCIDHSRLYIYGYSAGGIGALRFLKKHPGYFARAIIICAATANDSLEELSKTPLWLFHAIDDDIVKNRPDLILRDGAYLGSAGLYDALKEKMGENIRYTEYAAGELQTTYGINPHCAWVPVSLDETALRWLIER